jgi:lipoate-protein ligase A
MWIDDLVISRMNEKIALWCWIPDQVQVVLGSSNLASVECFEDRCKADGLSILKRYGGGGTVVLHPGCVVVTAGLWVKNLYQNGPYFQKINQSVIDCLADWKKSFKALGQNGISDICFEGKKVAGTSLFRSKNYLLYQASILFDPNLPLLQRYLRHPSREPTYRAGRSHQDFLTGLNAVDCSSPPEKASPSCPLTPELVAKHLQNHLASYLINHLKDDLIEPQTSHFTALNNRILRSIDHASG